MLLFLMGDGGNGANCSQNSRSESTFTTPSLFAAFLALSFVGDECGVMNAFGFTGEEVEVNARLDNECMSKIALSVRTGMGTGGFFL